MNLFVTDYSAIVAPNHLDDRRLGKMLIEANQLLSTAIRLIGIEDDRLCKITHKNHPVAIWTRSKQGNFLWVFQYACNAAIEYRQRFGKQHGAAERLNSIFDHSGEILAVLPEGADSFCNCAKNSKYGLDYTHMPVVEAYRKYLNYRWKYTDAYPPVWTNRKPPEWYQ